MLSATSRPSNTQPDNLLNTLTKFPASPHHRPSPSLTSISISQTTCPGEITGQTRQSTKSDYSLLHQGYTGPQRYPDLLSLNFANSCGSTFVGTPNTSILPIPQPQPVNHTTADNNTDQDYLALVSERAGTGNTGHYLPGNQGKHQRHPNALPHAGPLVNPWYSVTPVHQQYLSQSQLAYTSRPALNHISHSKTAGAFVSQNHSTSASILQPTKKKTVERLRTLDTVQETTSVNSSAQVGRTMNSMPPPPPPMHQNPGAMGGSYGSSAPATDKADITDALTMAGIDLREEEALASQLAVAAHTGPTSAEEAQIRDIAEKRANHANDPFLSFKVSEDRIRQIAMKNGLTVNSGVQGQPTSNEMMTYMSLSTRDYLLPLLTRAWSIARYRREGHSTITGEWAPYVKGGIKTTVGPDGTVQPSQNNPLKRK